MKAILVVDMPNYCCVCPFFRFKYRDDYDSKETVCTINGYVNENGIDTIASWCPLKPMPSKRKSMVEWVDANIKSHDLTEYDKGWNDCVEFLEGEDND